MLVTFSSDAYPNVTMLGDMGIRFLKMMGYSERALGFIKPEELPEAIMRLKTAVDNAKPEPSASDKNDDAEPPVSLAHRAFTLIEMLNASLKAKCDVKWKIT